jgi:cyclic-di-GMP-binding biofilm dispersal mediator protein
VSTFFEDKRYCIIGGSGALGSEIARELLARGATVHLVVRTPGNVPSDLSVSGISQGDIRNRESLRHALTSFGSTFNGLINAAGLVAFGSLTDVPQEIVSELYAVNAQGTVNVLSLAPEFLEEGGVIASLTGVAADMELLNMSAYCSSKSAAKSAMKVAGREFRSKKLSVLDIRAPHTETGLVNRALFGEAPKMPLGLSPQTVAQRIVKAIEEGEKDLPAESFS